MTLWEKRLSKMAISIVHNADKNLKCSAFIRRVLHNIHGILLTILINLERYLLAIWNNVMPASQNIFLLNLCIRNLISSSKFGKDNMILEKKIIIIQNHRTIFFISYVNNWKPYLYRFEKPGLRNDIFGIGTSMNINSENHREFFE